MARPPEANGRTLNLDFEKGTLDDWTATGDAFALIKGEVAPGQTPDKRGGKGSAYYAGSNTGGAIRKGTLTSTPFKVTQPYASFLLSGGAFTSTRVDLLLLPVPGDKAERQVIFTMSGANSGTMRPVVVDLKPYAGKDIAIQLVDDETGQTVASYLKESPWAHINFDQFRFHESRPFFPTEITSSEINTLPPMDPIKYNGLSGVEAAKAMTVPKGFTVKLAAAEPAIVRPIAFTLDDRGRLWVAEANTYPTRAPEGQGKDRILIFEDTNGDGTLDSRKIFIENLNLVSGLEVGFGGVWVGAAPYLMFIPVKAGTDVPSGPPQILLDGWGYQDTHEMLNTFTWGPDGWLYGTHGVFTHSNVGKPGAPDSDRQKLNGAIWRFHPTKHVFEVFAEGTSNPWGLDFNDYGHAFTTACVIEHLYQVVQGARYKRQAGKHFNPYIYDDIKTVADHVHWVGRQGPHAGNSRSALSRRRPCAFRRDDLPRRRHLAGGVPRRHLHEQHPRQPYEHRRAEAVGIGLRGDARTGLPSCERLVEPDAELPLRPRRRRLRHRLVRQEPVPQQQRGDSPEITRTHLQDQQRQRQAGARRPPEALIGPAGRAAAESQRLVRAARAAHPPGTRRRPGDGHAALKRILKENADVTRKLRAMWALHVTDGLTEPELIELMGNDNEYIRSWAVYLSVAFKSAVAGRGAAFRSACKNGHLATRAALHRQRLAAGACRAAVGRGNRTLRPR